MQRVWSSRVRGLAGHGEEATFGAAMYPLGAIRWPGGGTARLGFAGRGVAGHIEEATSGAPTSHFRGYLMAEGGKGVSRACQQYRDR